MTRLSHRARLIRRETIAEDVEGGLSLSEAAKKHDVSERTVYLACRENDTAPPVGRGGSTLLIYKELRSTGKKPTKVARELGVSVQRVHQVWRDARELGLYTRRRA